MKPPGLYPALLLALLLWLGSALAQSKDENDENYKEIEVSISGTSVTLVCPKEDDTTNAVKEIELTGPKQSIIGKGKEYQFTLQNYEESMNGEYTCTIHFDSKITSKRRKLYLKAKVCELCIEMEIWTVVGILVADLFITLGVVLLVYYWSKSKKGRTEGAGGPGKKPKGYLKARPPPVPNPDYEPIRKGQRELYDGLNSRAY
ncbi:T-cell surface glycoprotein CD3 epsilon chain [Rhinatrema bivittatum]|uniref:T-cell surface glycoprotein CD3 epsilon chain n=1 Tax=Rhinatrema bivittatum TaxID=194408 RepID=UPI00112E1609|nr:T-cell surface glycoprotein CD3 epsilon chain [Rhinatrema bivittatum]